MHRRALAMALVPFCYVVGCAEGTRSRDAGGIPAGSGGVPGTPGAAGTSAIGEPGADCPTGGSAQIDIQITGLPDGVESDVLLGGPAESWGIRSSRSLEDVVAGPYQVLAERVAAYDPIVRTMYDAQLGATAFCLAEGEAHSVEVQYDAVPTSHQLWTNDSSGGGQLLGFAAASLAASGSADPAVMVAGAGKDFTFDALGNIWTMGASLTDAQLVRFPSSSLAGSGALQPDRGINIAGVSCSPALRAFAFDLQGTLWVSTCEGSIAALSPDDLTASGTVTPAVELTNLAENGDVAFDYSGNLWVTEAGKVLRFNAERLSASSDQAPDLSLQLRDAGDTRDLAASYLVFDASGGLWAIDFAANLLSRVTLDDQALSGAQTVVAEKTLALGVTALVQRPAFDESGGLWLALDQNRFGRLSPEQLATSSSSESPTEPETIITSPGMGSANAMAFFPAPADLPLYHHFR